MNTLFPGYCGPFSNIDCTKSHVEIGMTDLGWETIIDRSENKIVLTYYKIYGIGQTATEKDIQEVKQAYESE